MGLVSRLPSNAVGTDHMVKGLLHCVVVCDGKMSELTLVCMISMTYGQAS